jgi:hypothetical protein
MEQEKVREQEPRPRDSGQHYEDVLRTYAEAREHAAKGKIVIKGKDLPWRHSRMGYTKRYLRWSGEETAAAKDWTVFIKDMKVHSGKHRHQGGIQLFVVDGEGSTVVDGVKVEWEKWDLIVLPVKPNGCEHQHFSKVEGQSAKWMAFRYHPLACVLGNLFEHVEDSPDW